MVNFNAFSKFENQISISSKIQSLKLMGLLTKLESCKVIVYVCVVLV